MKCVKRSLSKRIDKSYNDKFYSDNKKLMNILRDGEQYGKKQPHQEYAQAALKEFYKKLKSTSERKEYINRGSHLSYMFLLVKSVPGVFFPTSSTWTLLLTGMNCGKPTIRSVFAMRRLPWDAGPGFLKTASERRLPSVGEIFLSRR